MIRTPIFWLSIKRPLAFPSFWAWRDSLFPSTWPPVSTSLWRVTVEVWLIRIVEKCELSWTPSTNRKLTMQLKICLGNRTDKKCWHIIRLTDCLNNCFVPNYIKVPSQMCVCVWCVCPASCATCAAGWGSPRGVSLQENGWIRFLLGGLN